MNSSSHYCIVATISSLLYQFSHQWVLAFFGVEVLYIAEDLQTNAFLDLMVMEQEKCPYAL